MGASNFTQKRQHKFWKVWVEKRILFSQKKIQAINIPRSGAVTVIDTKTGEPDVCFMEECIKISRFVKPDHERN